MTDDPITPDERADARKSSEEGYSLWADTALRLLDALDTAEAEVARYRAQRDEWFLRESGAREVAEAEVVILRKLLRKARQQRDEAEAECDEAQEWAAAAVRDVLDRHEQANPLGREQWNADIRAAITTTTTTKEN